MRVNQVYLKYKIPHNLQEHMLRVGAVIKIITDQWTGKPVNQKAMIQTGLFHDLGKPMIFDLKKQSQWMTNKEIDELRQIQTELRKRYGNDEHEVLIGVATEIGCQLETLRLLKVFEWENVSQLMKDGDSEALVPIYADMRIGPMGILPLTDRFDDLNQRRPETKLIALLKTAEKLEQEIQAQTKVGLNKITNLEITDLFEYLLKLEV